MLNVDEYGVSAVDLVKVFRVGNPVQSEVTALDGVSVRINRGEVFAVVGPSGCGKSTLLRTIAGLEEPEQGRIEINGQVMHDSNTGASVSPQHRGVGMVFQDYALYPHLSVAENVGFGLKSRKVAKDRVATKVAEALRLVEMSEFADRSPAALSGGQRQRVAVARAIARDPGLLLLDEPLSNLDPLLRKNVRTELTALLRRLDITCVFVTHDQEEAMIVGDRIAVMNKGRVEQTGKPEEIYDSPATIFVAGFTGRPITNLVEGIIDTYEGRNVIVPVKSSLRMVPLPDGFDEYRGQRVTLHVRPEDVDVLQEPDGVTEARIQSVLPEGGHTIVHFDMGTDNPILVARCGPTSVRKDEIASTRSVRFVRGTIYSPESTRLLGSFGA